MAHRRRVRLHLNIFAARPAQPVYIPAQGGNMCLLSPIRRAAPRRPTPPQPAPTRKLPAARRPKIFPAALNFRQPEKMSDPARPTPPQ